MPKLRLGSESNLGTADGVDGFGALVPRTNGSTTEAETQIVDYGGHTYEDLYGYCSVHSGGFNAEHVLADDGVASTNLIVVLTGVGAAEDTTGTDSPAAGSLVGVHYLNQGMHGDSATFGTSAVTVSAGVAGIVGGEGGSIPATRYASLWGTAVSATASDMLTRLSRSTVFSNLRTNNGGSSTGDWAHYDGAKSTNLVVSYSADSGAKEDTTGTESNASGDDVGLIFDYVSGNPQNDTYQMDTDVDEVPRGANSVSGVSWSTTTQYMPVLSGRGQFGTGDVSGVGKATSRIGAEVTGNLHVSLNAYTSGTSLVFALRVNTTTSTNVTVSPSATGLVSDTTGSETLADADEVGFVQTASAVSGVTSTSHYIEIPSGTTATTGSAAVTIPSLTSAATGWMVPAGAAVTTLPSVTASASATQIQSGDAITTIPSVTASASGVTGAVSGDAATTIPSVTASANATEIQSGDAATTIPSVTTQADGWMVPAGDAAATLPSMVTSASATQIQSGDSITTIPSVTAAATGWEVPEGDAVATIPILTISASGDAGIVSGSSATQIPSLTAAAQGWEVPAGDAATTIPSLTTAATAIQIQSGDAITTIPSVTTAATGWEVPEGSAITTIPSLTASATGGTGLTEGDAATTLPSMTTAATGWMVPEGTTASTLPSLVTAAQGWEVPAGDAAPTIPSLAASASGTSGGVTGDAITTVPSLTAAAQGWEVPEGGATVTMPMLVSTATGAQTQSGAAITTLPSLTAAASGLVPTNGNSITTLPSITAAASGIVIVSVVSGSAAVTIPSLTSSAVATFTTVVPDDAGAVLWKMVGPFEFRPGSGYQRQGDTTPPPSGYDASTDDKDNLWKMT